MPESIEWHPVSELPAVHEAGIFRESDRLLLKDGGCVFYGKCSIMPDGRTLWVDEYDFINGLVTHWANSTVV